MLIFNTAEFDLKEWRTHRMTHDMLWFRNLNYDPVDSKIKIRSEITGKELVFHRYHRLLGSDNEFGILYHDQPIPSGELGRYLNENPDTLVALFKRKPNVKY